MNGLGLPVQLALTPGQAADVTQAETLIDGAPVEVVIADKGYDSRRLVRAIRARGAAAVIPARSSRRAPRVIDADRYRDRNLAERFGAKAKVYRRVATRYDKTARNFLAMVHVASITILLP